MRITIANRLKPYSHQPGTRCIIPGTAYAVEAFPTLLKIYDLSDPLPRPATEHFFEVEGPVEGFTVQQDLERAVVKVWGNAKSGYYRYSLFQKSGESGLILQRDKQSGTAPLPAANPYAERLSLGVHKAQNWCRIRERNDMGEIFPFWLRLGQWTPHDQAAFSECGFQELQQKFLGHFRNMFFPVGHDDEFHGIEYRYPPDTSPLTLLSEGAKQIRALFIREQGGLVMPLPSLPPAFPCGRMTHIQLGGKGKLDMEWRKRTMRRMVFHAVKEGSFHLKLPKKLSKMRMSLGKSDRGRVMDANEEIEIEPNQTYFFDRFE